MTRLREIFVTLKIDTGPAIAALKAAAEAVDRVHQAMHRAGIAITRGGDLKRVRAHRARCPICSPMANPHPLTIDGHAYARRRRNRRSRR